MNAQKRTSPVPQESSPNVSPVVRRRLAEVLDALSCECEKLAANDHAPPESYRGVLADIETLAEILREWDTRGTADPANTEWSFGDRAKEAAVARKIEQCSAPGVKRCGPMTLEEARRVIAELRESDHVLGDVQRALG